MTPKTILDFWFNELSLQDHWSGGDKLDQIISQRFAEHIPKAVNGEYQDWLVDAEGYLAFIILLDQFSRNVYRNTPQAFAQDELALLTAMRGVSANIDQALPVTWRLFFYMPFEHAEDLHAQQQSVKFFQRLCDEADAAEQQQMQGALDYAIKHYDVIKLFGRFPHRNPIVNRESTAEELAYLDQPGALFGNSNQ